MRWMIDWFDWPEGLREADGEADGDALVVHGRGGYIWRRCHRMVKGAG